MATHCVQATIAVCGCSAQDQLVPCEDFCLWQSMRVGKLANGSRLLAIHVASGPRRFRVEAPVPPQHPPGHPTIDAVDKCGIVGILLGGIGKWFLIGPVGKVLHPGHDHPPECPPDHPPGCPSGRPPDATPAEVFSFPQSMHCGNWGTLRILCGGKLAMRLPRSRLRGRLAPAEVFLCSALDAC